jgi:hypothetical protein
MKHFICPACKKESFLYMYFDEVSLRCRRCGSRLEQHESNKVINERRGDEPQGNSSSRRWWHWKVWGQFLVRASMTPIRLPIPGFLKAMLIWLLDLKDNSRKSEARSPAGPEEAAWRLVSSGLIVLVYGVVALVMLVGTLLDSRMLQPRRDQLMRDWEIKRKHDIEQFDQRLRRTPASP